MSILQKVLANGGTGGKCRLEIPSISDWDGKLLESLKIIVSLAEKVDIGKDISQRLFPDVKRWLSIVQSSTPGFPRQPRKKPITGLRVSLRGNAINHRGSNEFLAKANGKVLKLPVHCARTAYTSSNEIQVEITARGKL